MVRRPMVRARAAGLYFLVVSVFGPLAMLAHRAAAQTVNADPTSYDFGYVRIDHGDPLGANVTVTLTNTDPDHDSDVLVCEWSSDIHFSDSGCDGEVLFMAGGTLELTITALPIEFGSFTDTLTILYASSSAPLEITVSAEAPELWIAPGINGYCFPDTVVGTGSPPQETFTISNDDSVSHTLDPISQTGAGCSSFEVGTIADPYLQAQEATVFTVVFDPMTWGRLACDLAIQIAADPDPVAAFTVDGTGLLDEPIFADGFESGTTSAWAVTVP